MTKLLNIDEMLDVLSAIDHPAFSVLRASVERIGDQLGDAIAEALDINSGAASFEGSAFAGTCVPFYAKKIGQPCPEPMRDFDAEEWGTEEQDLDPETGNPI